MTFPAIVTISACESEFDTILIVKDLNGNVIDECDDCGINGDCSVSSPQCCPNGDGTQSQLTLQNLSPGTYIVTLEAKFPHVAISM